MDVPVLQIADRIVEVVTALHGSESQKEPSDRSSKCRHTQSDGEDRQRFSVLRSKFANAQDANIVSKQDPAVNW